MKCFSKYVALAATAAATVVILAVPKAYADSLSIVTTAPVGSDTVNWSQLSSPGITYVPVPNPFSATSAGGIHVTGTFAGAGGGAIAQQNNGFGGNFSPGDYVLSTYYPGQNINGNGPLTLNFNQGGLAGGRGNSAELLCRLHGSNSGI